jgi:hypothetical protein
MCKFIKNLLRNKKLSFKKNTLWFIFVYNLCIFNLQAQILNDSTQNVYGASTTRFTHEYQVFQKKDTLSKIDTSLRNFHSFDLVRKNRFLFQDLGHNLGTPAKPVFYILPSQVGVQWGIRAYDFHKLTTDSVKYYDSRSPYSDFTFVQGGRGQQIAGVEFTRNVKAHFNFGFKFSRTNTFRQYAESGNRTENAILEQYNTLFWARYFSKNQKYKLLFHYYNFSSPLKELGGVAGGANFDTLYNYAATTAQLGGPPKSWKTYNRLRLYHEYSTDSTRKLSFFQVIQFERERDNYVDESYLSSASVLGNQSFYIQNTKDSILPINYIYANGVYDDYKFRLLTNQLGVRTSLRNIVLLGYFKRRDYELNSFVDNFYKIKGRNENYLGGQVFMPLPLKSTLEGKAEYWIGSKDYLLEGVLNNRFLQVFLKSLSVSPTLFENRYVSRISNWNNLDTLKNTFIQELFAQSVIPFKFGFLKPSARYQIITNHTYFTRDTAFIFPTQARNTIQILQLGLESKFSIKNLHFEHQIFYTQDLSSSNIIRFPEWHIWGSWYYQKNLFKNALLLRTGIDWHYRTAYYADAYMPAVKQFYLQNNYLVRAYPIVDIFASLLIKKTRVFIKMSHVNDGILAKPDNGYVVTPFYAGLRRTFSLGFSWRLFD